MGRFGIWVWTAAIISILSKTALLATVRSFVFFIGMLSAYFLIWQIHKERHYTNFISSLPFMIFFTEWYFTAFTGRYWTFSTVKDELPSGIAYLCFIFSFSAVIPTNKKRLFSLLYGVLESIILTLLIRTDIIVNPYNLLNI